MLCTYFISFVLLFYFIICILTIFTQRFYFKNDSHTCFKYDLSWTGELISCLGLDTQITSFAVSDDVTTINRENSWILEDSSWSSSFNVSDADVIANLANCKTPSGTSWYITYEGGERYQRDTL